MFIGWLICKAEAQDPSVVVMPLQTVVTAFPRSVAKEELAQPRAWLRRAISEGLAQS
jgi:hypothetical protein